MNVLTDLFASAVQLYPGQMFPVLYIFYFSSLIHLRMALWELNNRTKEARPEDFVRDETRFYVRRWKNRGTGNNIVFKIIII